MVSPGRKTSAFTVPGFSQAFFRQAGERIVSGTVIPHKNSSPASVAVILFLSLSFFSLLFMFEVLLRPSCISSTGSRVLFIFQPAQHLHAEGAARLPSHPERHPVCPVLLPYSFHPGFPPGAACRQRPQAAVGNMLTAVSPDSPGALQSHRSCPVALRADTAPGYSYSAKGSMPSCTVDTRVPPEWIIAGRPSTDSGPGNGGGIGYTARWTRYQALSRAPSSHSFSPVSSMKAPLPFSSGIPDSLSMEKYQGRQRGIAVFLQLLPGSGGAFHRRLLIAFPFRFCGGLRSEGVTRKAPTVPAVFDGGSCHLRASIWRSCRPLLHPDRKVTGISSAAS